MLKEKIVYVWVDWSSGGIWEPNEDGGISNMSYETFGLSDELIQRFEFWTRWFDDHKPEWTDERNNMDWDLFRSYGISLAVDLKEFLGDEHQVFFGHPTDKVHFEVLLKENPSKISSGLGARHFMFPVGRLTKGIEKS